MQQDQSTELVRRQPVTVHSTIELSATDPMVHTILRDVLAISNDPSPRKRAVTGLKLPLRVLGFLKNNPTLWPSVVWPVVINFLLLGVGLIVVFTQATGITNAIWAQPSSRALIAIWWILNVAVHVLSSVFTYIGVMIVGPIFTSPFNDIISERTEALMLGERYVDADLPFWPSTLRSIRSTFIIAFGSLGILIPLLVLHLVPVVGSIAYTLVAGAVGSYFVAAEHCDTLLERKQFQMRVKFSRIWEERHLAMGFGLGTSVMLAIPLLNFLCLPLAVITGTIVGLALEQKELYGPLALEGHLPTQDQ